MALTTFEEAKRCPKCKVAGKLADQRPQGSGITVHTFECENSRCERSGERWIVQTNPDGSIPQHTQGPKTFPKLDHYAMSAQRARDELAILDIQSTHPNLTRQEIIRMLGGLWRSGLSSGSQSV